MAKLTKEQKDYIKSMRNWQSRQDLVIQELKNNLSNSKKIIFLQTEFSKLYKEQINHEIHFTKNAMNEFYKWLEQNNITEKK